MRSLLISLVLPLGAALALASTLSACDHSSGDSSGNMAAAGRYRTYGRFGESGVAGPRGANFACDMQRAVALRAQILSAQGGAPQEGACRGQPDCVFRLTNLVEASFELARSREVGGGGRCGRDVPCQLTRLERLSGAVLRALPQGAAMRPSMQGQCGEDKACLAESIVEISELTLQAMQVQPLAPACQ